jgi:aldose 1-epimerase
MKPSGEQFELRHGDQRATVVEVGGGLRHYTVGDREVLDGYGENELCRSGRGQVLAPWPNRIEDGVYEHDGERHQLPNDDLAAQCAIHGLVRWRSLHATGRTSDAVTLGLVLHPQPGYPFSLRLAVTYRLTHDGLSVQTYAENLGERTCPFGLGQHPYLIPLGAAVDEARLLVPAVTVLSMGERSLPNAAAPVSGELDLREGRVLGGTVLDTGYTDLLRDEDGLARVRFDDLTLWVDGAYGYLQVFTGDPLPDVARRSLAVEPMTCPANAFRSGDGLLVLAPGQAFEANWGLAVAT